MTKWDFPEWYQDCFHEAFVRGGKEGSLYGKCLPNPKEEPLLTREYLSRIQEKSFNVDLTRAINSDLKLLINEPFHLYIGVGESKLSFNVEYGKISGKLARYIAKEKPLIAVRAISLSLFNTLFHGGVNFFTGKYYEPQLIPLPSWHKKIAFILVPFFLLGVVCSYLFIGLVIFKRRYYDLLLDSAIDKIFLGFLIRYCSVNIILIISMFGVSTCCENGRMIVGILPHALLLALASLSCLVNIRNSKLVQ
jgi:hypothetical protein